MATLGSSQPPMVAMETEKPTATMALGPRCRRRRLWDSKQTPGARQLGEGRAPAHGVAAHPDVPNTGQGEGRRDSSVRDTRPRRGLAPRAPSSPKPPSPRGGDSAGWVVSTSPAPARSPRTLCPLVTPPWAQPPSPEAAKRTEGLGTRAREPVTPAPCPLPRALRVDDGEQDGCRARQAPGDSGPLCTPQGAPRVRPRRAGSASGQSQRRVRAHSPRGLTSASGGHPRVPQGPARSGAGVRAGWRSHQEEPAEATGAMRKFSTSGRRGAGAIPARGSGVSARGRAPGIAVR